MSWSFWFGYSCKHLIIVCDSAKENKNIGNANILVALIPLRESFFMFGLLICTFQFFYFVIFYFGQYDRHWL